MEKNEPTQSKYDAALAKYNTQLDDAEIAAQAARIIAEKVPANNTPEVKKFLFMTLEDSPISQYSYPSIIQGKDGKLHAVYTWRRQRVAYKELDLSKLK